MSRDLPEFPNLDHLKKQAKALLRALQQRNPETKLAEAQHSIARTYGFASWARLKVHVELLPRPADPDPPTGAEESHSGRGGTTGGPLDPPSPQTPGDGGPGRFVRYTETARRAIFFARYWAHQRGGQSIETEHLLLGLIDADGNLIERLLRDPFPSEKIREEIDRRTTIQEKASGVQTPLSSECRRILERAAEEADRLRHERITTGHFLLGFLYEEGSLATSILIDILAEKEIGLDTARNDIVQMLNERAL